MNCSSCERLISAYIDDELDQARRVEIEEHLDGCEKCRSESENHMAAWEAAGDLRSRSAPDGLWSEIESEIETTTAGPAAAELARVAVDSGAAGLVLTNTTVDYSLVPEPQPVGGLSGRVLGRRSLELLRVVAAEVFGRCVLVSVGGIETAADIYARLRAGAQLVQIYTALVYGGSHVVQKLNEELLHLLDSDGVADVASAVGLDV